MNHKVLLKWGITISQYAIFFSYEWFVPISWTKNETTQPLYWLLNKNGELTVTITITVIFTVEEMDHPKMIILSLHIHVIPNPYDFVSYVEHQSRSLAECSNYSIPYNYSEWRLRAVKLQKS